MTRPLPFGRRFGRRALLRAGATAASALAVGLRPAAGPAADPLDVVLAYHERSKHRVDRSAPAPGRVDWSAQPDPFRRYVGAPLLPLPLEDGPAAPTWEVVRARAVQASAPVDRAALSRLLLDSLALSAWKERGADRWSLRVNPSSGNLHPTEVYLAGGPFPGVPGVIDGPALLHYAPHEHGLERLAALPAGTWRGIASGLPPRAFLAALSSIHWREAWKYGERGWRYCLLDAGHAVAALSVAAAALGWRARLAEAWVDRDVARLAGVDRQSGPEAERAEALLVVWPGPASWPRDAERAFGLGAGAFELLGRTEWAGVPNRISAQHRAWPAMEGAARAAERAEPPGDAFWAPERPPPSAPPVRDRGPSARALVRQRRTALRFDRAASISRDALFGLLRAVMPAVNRAIFDPLPWRPVVHLALFVHRVDGVAPGLYLLPRDPTVGPELRAAIHAGQGQWAAVEGAPPDVPLVRLAGGDLRAKVEAASCDQEIAADGVFTAAMLARFDASLQAHGAWMYRRLHLEAGAVGHALYLEAEAADLGGTAMGCFLDDETHALLDLEERAFQAVYHFAVGRPREDPRLRTAAPYAHLQGR